MSELTLPFLLVLLPFATRHALVMYCNVLFDSLRALIPCENRSAGHTSGHLKLRRLKYVLSCNLNELKLGALRTENGRLFHTLDAAHENRREAVAVQEIL